MSVKSALKIKLNGQWVAVPVMIGDAEVDGVVRYDEAQTLTEEEKALARENIGAGTGGDVDIPNDNLVNGQAAGSIQGTGENTAAEAEHSFAFGYECKARGQYSWAIGDGSRAKGRAAFAVGQQAYANASCAFATGNATNANGISSHAEGELTYANGDQSHAEGMQCEAKGIASHAEGYGTIAGSDHQHVQGQYNLEDTDGVYAHIVGNGNWEEPSNAHTIDWNGNAWYAGTVKSTGLRLTAPNGTEYLLTIADDGTINVTAQ